ncbi:MAG: peptide chain release factor N(5)-glutamine methyltransferase [bacterium]
MSEPRAEDEAWTIGRLIRWTTDFLAARQVDSPRLEAEILLAHALGWPRMKLYMHINEEVGSLGRSSFRELVKKRAAGMPVAYVVGHKEFYSLDFQVNQQVLIPRSDTETLVMAFLELAKSSENPLCVDVGTGSGCITVTCLKHHATARFIAIDQSAVALEIARINAEKHQMTSRVEFRHGDLIGPLQAHENPLFILSNPPYIPSADILVLEPQVRDFEPHSALDGGTDGLSIIRRLVDQASEKLAPGGYLLIEIGFDQARAVSAEFASHPALDFKGVRKDLAGHARVLVMQKAL